MAPDDKPRFPFDPDRIWSAQMRAIIQEMAKINFPRIETDPHDGTFRAMREALGMSAGILKSFEGQMAEITRNWNRYLTSVHRPSPDLSGIVAQASTARPPEALDLSPLQELATEVLPWIDEEPAAIGADGQQPVSRVEILAMFLLTEMVRVLIDRGVPPTEEMMQWLTSVVVYVITHLQ